MAMISTGHASNNGSAHAFAVEAVTQAAARSAMGHEPNLKEDESQCRIGAIWLEVIATQ